MRRRWPEVAAMTGLVAAGMAAMYLGLRRIAARRQQATDEKIASLSTSVRALQARVAEVNRALLRTQESDAISAAAEGAPMTRLDAPKPETLAVITAAATAFLGKAARVRAAHLVPAAPESASAWSQQGRVIVQTSHNLRVRE